MLPPPRTDNKDSQKISISSALFSNSAIIGAKVNIAKNPTNTESDLNFINEGINQYETHSQENVTK